MQVVERVGAEQGRPHHLAERDDRAHVGLHGLCGGPLRLHQAQAQLAGRIRDRRRPASLPPPRGRSGCVRTATMSRSGSRAEAA